MTKLGTQSLLAGVLAVTIFFTVTFYGGTFALLLNSLLVLGAIIMGIIGMKAENKSQKTQAIIGLLLGIATILIGLGLFFFNN